MTTDTIVAQSTPPGVAALALVRLSGPASRAIVEQLVTAKFDATPGHAAYRTLAHAGQTLDDVVLTFWRAPHSFTGEDTVEISCHGNPHIVESIVRACLELGARMARPGEFTQRAFLNDKLSLTQAEGLLGLLYAPTERALASARAMKEGKLGAALEALRAELIDLLSHLEASLDFAEEGIEPRDKGVALRAAETDDRERGDAGRRAEGDDGVRGHLGTNATKGKPCALATASQVSLPARTFTPAARPSNLPQAAARPCSASASMEG